MTYNKITLLTEEFINDKTNEKVEGVTIIIDGKLKEVIDLLMLKNPKYNNYTEVVRDCIFEGLEKLI